MTKRYQHFLASESGTKENKKRKTHRLAPKAQERKVAAAIGGRRQVGSGSQEGLKGDAVRDDDGLPLLGECKRTSGKRSISVKVEWLAKISREAESQNAYPFLSIQFDRSVMEKVARERGVPPPEEDWVMIPLSLWEMILERLGEEGVEG